MANINRARFTISGTPSEDANGKRGYDATPGEELAITLESNPALGVLTVTYSLADANDPTAPLNSLFDLPQEFVENAGTSITLTQPNQTVNITIDPGTQISAYTLRAVAVTATGAHIFERMIVVRQEGLRMTIPAETTQYAPRGWSDALNELTKAVIAIEGGGGGGTGDVVGPASSTDNALARFNGTSGKIIQNSVVTLSDTGVMNFGGGNKVIGTNVEALSTAATNTTWVLRPDGSGGITFAPEAAGLDPNAIHKNVSAEISTVTLKGTPAGADLVLIEDSADGNSKKRVTITSIVALAGSGGDPDAYHKSVAGEISTTTLKGTPVGADLVLIEDSAAANAKKRVTLTSIIALVGPDTDAIHKSVSSEISTITSKATPTGSDLALIEDVAAGNAKKRVTLASIAALASGTDANAIHKNVAAEISTVTLKATPAGADLILIEDSAAANAKKRVTITSIIALASSGDADAYHKSVSGEIASTTLKGTPIGADMLLIEDSVASNAKKRVTITSILNMVPTVITDHGDLTGLGDNDHPQYWLTAGSSNFENFYYGSSLSSGQLVIGSTSHATKGPITVWGSVVQVAGSKITQVGTCTAGTDAANKAYVDSVAGGGAGTDHGGLTGLSDDDHSIYWLTAGRAGSQVYYGSNASGGQLTIGSSSHGTKGPLVLWGSHVSANFTQIKNVSTPTASGDAATKGYVDGLIVTNHNALSNLTTGDVHTHYWLTAGRAGNQTYYGSSSSGGQLMLQSTSHATKGPIDFIASEIDVNFTQIKQLNDPTAARDAVTKQYADSKVFGQLHATTTSGIISSGTGVGTWIKCPNTTATSQLTGGVTNGGVSNRLVAPEPGSYRVAARVWMRTNGANTYDKLRRIRLAYNEVGLGDTEIRHSFGGSATGTAHLTFNTEIIHTLGTGGRLEVQYFKEDSFAFVIEQIHLSIQKISAVT